MKHIVRAQEDDACLDNKSEQAPAASNGWALRRDKKTLFNDLAWHGDGLVFLRGGPAYAISGRSDSFATQSRPDCVCTLVRWLALDVGVNIQKLDYGELRGSYGLKSGLAQEMVGGGFSKSEWRALQTEQRELGVRRHSSPKP